MRNCKGVIQCVVVFYTAFIGTLPLQASQTGGLPGAYLRPSVGAQALALGGAVTASADNFAPWWNPAALAILRGRRLGGGVGIRSMGRTDAYASFEFRVPPRVGIGAMILYRGDPFVNDLYDENEKPIGNASFTTFTGKIALSYLVNRKLGAGVNVGILHERLPTSSENGKVSYSTATGIGSIDFALNYKASEKLSLAMTVKNLWASLMWETDDFFSITVEDRPLPVGVVAGKYDGMFQKKPFIWYADLQGQIIDGKFGILDRPQAQFDIGWEWRYFETFFIRAGIGDVLLNGNLVKDREAYREQSGIRISTGFSLDASKVKKGLRVNYGISTDKVWAGVDQQLDCIYSF